MGIIIWLIIGGIVGWLASCAPLWGKEPHRSLSKGSSRKESESFWSSYPQAI